MDVIEAILARRSVRDFLSTPVPKETALSIFQELGIPDGLNRVTGIGLGYPDPQNIINTYRSPRRPIAEVVRYKS
jgi:nitroreductase